MLIRSCEPSTRYHFSALQRAENSSIAFAAQKNSVKLLFQCSSASRKFLNPIHISNFPSRSPPISVLFSEPKIPQYSITVIDKHLAPRISVLFSEPKIPQSLLWQPSAFGAATISVLFSEPKIPQCPRLGSVIGVMVRISVLFSEPKIPQSYEIFVSGAEAYNFSALQRAENSSMNAEPSPSADHQAISVLFSEPKIPQFI